MVQMTFDEYDRLIEKFEGMTERVYWPTEEQIAEFSANPEKWLMFCIFLYEMNPAPSNEDEKKSKKAMMKFINSELELIDECDDES